MTDRRLIVPLLLLLCLVAFLPGIGGPFLLDDEANLLRARASTGMAADAADAALRNASGLLRRPVSNITFLFNYHFIGATPLHYKAVNLVVHFICALLVWQLALLVLRNLRPAADPRQNAMIAVVCAALWAIHPLQVSTVLYVVQRMAQLSTLFTLAGIIAALRMLPALNRAASPWASLRAIVVVGLMFALSVLSKENGALAPLLLLTVLVCLPADAEAKPRSDAARWFVRTVCYAPLLLAPIALWLAWDVIEHGYVYRDWTMAQRIATEPFVLLHYLRSILLPQLSQMGLYLEDFPLRSLSDPLAIALLAGFAAAAIGAWVLRRKWPLLAFAVLWFLASHAMESTIIALELAFEHRNYGAMFGPLLVVVAAVVSRLRALQPRQIALLACLPVLVLGGLTLRRAHTWSNYELFGLNEVRNHPDSPRALTHAASIDIARGDIDAAVMHIRRAQELRPNSFWIKAYDLHLRCAGAPLPEPWDALMEQAERRPFEMGIEEAIKLPAATIFTGGCKAIDRERFHRFVVELIERLRPRAPARLIERLHIVQRMLVPRDTPDVGEELLRAGSRANPEGTEALTILAYACLNRGEIACAEQATDEIERRLRLTEPSTALFEVIELRQFIADARAAGG